jgi:hypothetical protein
MTTATATKDAGPKLRVPPEEKFWKRYSPHGEAPLSLGGSVALHIIVGGTLLVLGIFAASLFGGRGGKMPVEPVRFGLPGGGGNKFGVDKGKGVGGAPKEDTGRDEETLPGQDIAPPLPKLSPVELKALEEKFDPETVRRITETKSESARAIAKLTDEIRKTLRPTSEGPIPGKGQGGGGRDGGKGDGVGSGEGPGTGPGKAKLNAREKRMLRWHMRFTARSGPEYLAQLRGLGAIIAFPTSRDQIYLTVHPGSNKANEEDVTKIQRIYWIDDKPGSVQDIIAALGLSIAPPPRFVAFMPEKLEKDLYDMEKRYVTKTLRRPFIEDKIDETNFRVVHTSRGWRPELVSVSMKP